MFPLRNLMRNFKKAILEPKYAFKAFIKRSQAWLNYSFNKKGESSYPEAITLFLTYRCNLRCHMCGQWGDSGSNKNYDSKKINEEIPLEILEKFLDEINKFYPHITLFGGEPLLYKDVDKLIMEIKKRRLHCCIITNGVLVEKFAEVIVDSKLDELSLSIDGPEEIHDSIRNVKGTFKKIKKGVDLVNELKSKKNQKLPVINIVFTISNLNYNYMKEMIDVARGFHCDTLNFHHLIFTEENVLKQHNELFKKFFNQESYDWQGFILPDIKNINVDKLIEDIRDIQNERYTFLVDFYPNFTFEEIKEYYTNPNFISKSYPDRCLSPWIVSYIYPDGSVLPCHSLSYSVGNIKEKSFLEIWNGERFKNFRRILKKEKYFPICPKCTEKYRY